MQWYLALGDSLAAGYQPTTGDDLDGGYVGHVLEGVQEDYAKTRLVNLACSGETSAEMIDGGDCSYDQGSQLAAAEQFLRAHKDKVSTVTIHIGANDVAGCVYDAVPFDPQDVPAAIELDTCLRRGLAAFDQNLDTILTRLRAASPSTDIVIGNYYNPFLAGAVLPPLRDLAPRTIPYAAALNNGITVNAEESGAEVADVAAAFDNDTPGLNVSAICTNTWMCQRLDIHANNLGYALIGDAFMAVLAE
ncbi:SGNH/GDSL hydrolase family protein [Ornithinimicrobium sp. W1665]|uniref:SGNH/GDSL hydrolase family protein n=1 Tax=Ornithinimicrobium sp. W1665 TaxID=3416666 RepID=UPI003D6A84BD